MMRVFGAPKNTICDTITLNSSDLQLFIQEAMGYLKPDIDIVTSGGDIVHANKLVMSQSSPFLKSLLTSDVNSPPVDRINLPDVSAPSLVHLMNIITNGFTTGPGSGYLVLREVRDVADFLGFEDVQVLTFVGQLNDSSDVEFLLSPLDYRLLTVMDDGESSNDPGDYGSINDPLRSLSHSPSGSTHSPASGGASPGTGENPLCSLSHSPGGSLSSAGALPGTGEIPLCSSSHSPSGSPSSAGASPGAGENPLRSSSHFPGESSASGGATPGTGENPLRSSSHSQSESLTSAGASPGENEWTIEHMEIEEENLPIPIIIPIRRKTTSTSFVSRLRPRKTSLPLISDNLIIPSIISKVVKYRSREVTEVIAKVLKVEQEDVSVPSFPCGVCTMKCSNASTLMVHSEKHWGKRSNRKCTLCTFSGCRPAMLKHIRAKHTKENLFSCAFCKKLYHSSGSKMSHEKKH